MPDLMKLETILNAAKNSMIRGHHSPHCFSSHLPGQGYIGNETTNPDHFNQLERAVQSEIDNIGFAPGYAEPGYTDPAKGILFADWNNFPRNFDKILERAGYECEWSDEWSTCCDCGKAVRTSPDCYHWTSYYRILNECELVCLDCLNWEEYLEAIEDNPRSACPPEIDPADYGYTKFNGDFETGLHAHMTDDPKKTLKAMQDAGLTNVVFRIKENSQFYTTWEAYHKTATE